jgi:hypothetical protein
MLFLYYNAYYRPAWWKLLQGCALHQNEIHFLFMFPKTPNAKVLNRDINS